jgi:hypothetical protein
VTGPGRRLAAAAALLASAGCGLDTTRRAETVPVEVLPVAADTIVTPYGELPNAAWLGGRRWLVVAGDHDAAVIADFARDTVRPVGGGGHGELAKPFNGFAVGDTIYVADWGRARITVWSPEGRLIDTVPASPATRGILPRARDAAGNFYFEVPPLPGPDGRGNRDSIAIVRSDPALTAFDTVAHLAPLDIAEAQLNTGRRFERLIFSGNDWWGVRPDGRLWIARVNLNRVNTVAAGKETRGEALPDPVLEVKRIDREVFIQSFPDEVRGALEKMPFAALKPPFERAFAGPEGNVWLRKSRAWGDSTRRYHVVAPDGRLARVFTTVGDGVLVAAGRETALMAEQHSGGVRLMEIRIPDPPPAAATP